MDRDTKVCQSTVIEKVDGLQSYIPENISECFFKNINEHLQRKQNRVQSILLTPAYICTMLGDYRNTPDHDYAFMKGLNFFCQLSHLIGTDSNGAILE